VNHIGIAGMAAKTLATQWAAALLLAHQRCDPVTTLATLTPNSAAVAR
jgi:hypothetical protein